MTVRNGPADGILVIVTGGTIGMVPGPHGLIPEIGRVEAAIERLAPAGQTIKIERFNPLLDSAHVDHTHWNRIIERVEAWPGAGIVVTHGTDTMAFTGAALAFALAGLDRRVLLCGAMRPLGTDGAAERDLAFALASASDAPPGTWLASGGRLLPGHSLVKRSSTAGNAFVNANGSDSPPARPGGARSFGPHRLAILTISPGLPATALRAALSELDGVVLRVYGAGAAPADPDILSALAKAIAEGRRIVAVSQCETGGLTPGAYASGAPLWEVGVQDGGARTPEAALASVWLDLSAGRENRRPSPTGGGPKS